MVGSNGTITDFFEYAEMICEELGLTEILAAIQWLNGH